MPAGCSAAQLRLVGGVGGERSRVDTGMGEGAQVVGVPVGAAGDQRDPVALLAESVCDGHAEAWAGAEDENHESIS
jgi:hypothetical protein